MAAELTPEERRIIRACEARIASIRGQKLSKSQEESIAWLHKRDAATAMDQLTRAFPKGQYCALAGRQHKVIDDHANKYGLPLRSPALDLRQVFTAFHDFLQTNAGKLKSADLSDANRADLEKEKLKLEIATMAQKAELLKLELVRKAESTISRDEVRGRLQWLSGQLRTFTSALQAKFGDEAVVAMNTLLDKIEKEILAGTLSMEIEEE